MKIRNPIKNMPRKELAMWIAAIILILLIIGVLVFTQAGTFLRTGIVFISDNPISALAVAITLFAFILLIYNWKFVGGKSGRNRGIGIGLVLLMFVLHVASVKRIHLSRMEAYQLEADLQEKHDSALAAEKKKHSRDLKDTKKPTVYLKDSIAQLQAIIDSLSVSSLVLTKKVARLEKENADLAATPSQKPDTVTVLQPKPSVTPPSSPKKKEPRPVVRKVKKKLCRTRPTATTVINNNNNYYYYNGKQSVPQRKPARVPTKKRWDIP